VRLAELAVVQDQHPHATEDDTDNFACTVTLRDSGIVLKRVPVATGHVGAAWIPNVGDLVLIQFVGGDVHAPVITGRLYNDQDRPPPNEDGKAVLHVPLGAGDADAVHVELHSGGTRAVSMSLGSGLTLTLQDDDPAVRIEVGGNAVLTIGQDGSLSVANGQKVEIKGPEITIEADGVLTLKGSQVKIN
jgi:uncharacterized protein involved in type VI secretion and phage assembly